MKQNKMNETPSRPAGARQSRITTWPAPPPPPASSTSAACRPHSAPSERPDRSRDWNSAPTGSEQMRMQLRKQRTRRSATLRVAAAAAAERRARCD
jgi:hypothetical protein